MGPIRSLTEQGYTVLVVHHHGHDTQRSRGASALLGESDVIIDLFDQGDRRRKLKIVGRPHDVLSSLHIELAEDGSGYTVLSGPAADTPIKDDALSILKAMSPPAEGWTVKEIQDHWPHDLTPNVKTIQNNAKSAGLTLVAGTGSKKTPARYTRPIHPPVPVLQGSGTGG
jgi:hypothetical protein